MDYTRLDKVRKTTTPLQLDAVESFAQGRISRREFIRRGTLVGLSMASISAVVAACGGAASPSPSQSSASGGGSSASPGASPSAAAVKTGGSIKVACQKPVALDTIA